MDAKIAPQGVTIAREFTHKRSQDDLPKPVDSIADGMQALDLAAHEWIGFATDSAEFTTAP